MIPIIDRFTADSPNRVNPAADALTSAAVAAAVPEALTLADDNDAEALEAALAAAEDPEERTEAADFEAEDADLASIFV